MSLFKKVDRFLAINILIIASYCNPGYAKSYTKLALQQIAIDFVAENLAPLTSGKRQLSAAPLDPRIPERSCNRDLQVSAANSALGNRQTTIKIKCLDENNWQQFVQVRNFEQLPVVILNNNIAKGDLINQSDLSIAYKAKHLIRAHSTDDVNTLIGSRAKRNLRSGQIVNNKYLCNICKGDRVTIIAHIRGLKIKTSGEALEDGRIGQQIRVKNAKSGNKIQAKVKTVDMVEVSI